MEALVLEETKKLKLRDISLTEPLGPRDVRIRIHTVGICGSDVHYYQHVASARSSCASPMVLGHEAAGIDQRDRPRRQAPEGRRPGSAWSRGIPDPHSRATRQGMYNLDPAVRFWATPPVHGCLRPTVVHPAAFTFRLPDSVSFAEGAMVEPLGRWA